MYIYISFGSKLVYIDSVCPDSCHLKNFLALCPLNSTNVYHIFWRFFRDFILLLWVIYFVFFFYFILFYFIFMVEELCIFEFSKAQCNFLIDMECYICMYNA